MITLLLTLLKEKLDEFDDQLATQIEEIEHRLQLKVENSVALQGERVERVEGQLEKLGEEIAFDINKIHKMARRS